MYPIVRILKMLRRNIYSIRLLLPGLKEQHRIEGMVGPLGVWDECRAYQINCLLKLGLKPDHFLADIGCGPLQGGVAFIDYLDSGKYVGVDNDSERLDSAYRQIWVNKLARKNPCLIYSETFGEKEFGTRVFDCFWVSQIFYHFTEMHIVELLKVVLAHSHKESVLYADFVGPEHPENITHEYDMTLHTVESLQRICEPLGFTVEYIGRIAEYGYPKRLILHTNMLVRISRFR